MFGRRFLDTLHPVTVGIAAAAGLGFVNRAAHESEWGSVFMGAGAGLLAAWTAARTAALKSPGPEVAWSATGAAAALSALLLTATYLESRTLWSGGAWLAAAGALAALVLDVVAAIRRKDLRRPEALCLAALAGGVVLARYSPWGAALGGAAALLPVALTLVKGRLPGALESSRSEASEAVYD